METDEKRRGKDAAALSGGHLCHVCGYQYPNPHPSAKLRRSHRKHCGKAVLAPAAVEEEKAPVGPPATDREAGNAGDSAFLGGKGGEAEGKSEANGGAALLGSAREVGELVEDKAVAEHASSNGTGVHHATREVNENGQINCMNTENASPGDKVKNSALSKNGLVDCSNSGNQNELAKHCSELVPATVTNPAQREDSFDEYQDASPFLPQSEGEDGALPSSEFPVEINNLNTVLSRSSAAADEFSLGTSGLCNNQVSGELNLNDLSAPADSKVGNDSDNGTLSLAGSGATLQLEAQCDSYKNVSNNYTDMIDNKSDKTFYDSEPTGDVNASSLQEVHSVVLDTDSQSTFFRKMQGAMEDTVHPLQNMYEASPRPEAAEASNSQFKTLNGSSSNYMPIGNELVAVHSENNSTDSSTELSTQNCPVKDTSDVQLPVENLCQKNLYSTAGFQNNLPPTSYVDDMMSSTTKDSCSDLDFTFEAMTQQEVVEQVYVTEENPSVQKISGFTEDEVCNRQIDPEVLTEDQFPKSQKRAMFPMGQTSCAKNPFDLDNDRNDDLFELPSDSCYLEVSSAVSRQQVDSASLILDQPTVSNQTRMAEAQHSCNSNDASSSTENDHPVGPKDIPGSSSAELVMNTRMADVSLDHHLQELEAHSNDISFALYQVPPMEFHTVGTQDTSALGTGAEENTQTKDVAAKEMTVIRTTDDTGMKQADDTTALDTYTINVEAKKVTNDTAAKMDEVQNCNVEEKHTDITKEVNVLQSMSDLEENKEMTVIRTTDDTGMKQADDTTALDTYTINVEAKKVTNDTAAKMDEVQNCNVEEKHTDITKEVNVLQSMSDLEENKLTEDPNMKEMNTQVNADDLEDKWKAGDNFEEMCGQATRVKEVIALQCTEKVDENKQTNSIVGQEGDNKNEEIAVTDGRLNSGRIRVPLKVLLAEASAENKVNKPSAKERVLSLGRRVSKNDNSSAKPGSPKSGSDDRRWESPAKLPRKDTDKSSKGKKQPWMPFICCHSVR
ncbi:hypothetical protein QOZ80_6AG0540480 [Eleusine coracana subsp. coracana]|nr:hypothetical protein QOZ80_6AG0540480 [Eleusine coracana subsp. coracana]